MRLEEMVRFETLMEFDQWMAEHRHKGDELIRLEEFMAERGIDKTKEFLAAKKEKQEWNREWDDEGLSLGDFLHGYD